MAIVYVHRFRQPTRKAVDRTPRTSGTSFRRTVQRHGRPPLDDYAFLTALFKPVSHMILLRFLDFFQVIPPIADGEKVCISDDRNRGR